ncbi:MAG: cytochrome c biogenesis CcdA family protein [Candidatus Woesebacteria bacterium]|nr:cytochrome c biogenesis CcdA family protein [Candidatus Woesebacteria bacterium]
MDLLISASFIAAFLAGIAALFAPCCITVLLPTYFASIFKQKRKVFFMTFIFLLGLLTVFIPIGLGISAISQTLRDYHDLIFISGGFFVLILGTLLTLGKQLSLPSIVHPKLKNYDVFSVFVLGIFSGIATTCCAPVLAGVLALSALSGSYLLGSLYTLTYVLGMVTPLFILSAYLDRVNFTGKFFAFRKPITFNIFKLKITNTIANLFSGLMFLLIGIIILYLAFSNKLTMQNDYQLSVNIFIAQVTKIIGNFTKFIPEPIWGLFFTGIFILLLIKALKEFKKGGDL